MQALRATLCGLTFLATTAGFASPALAAGAKVSGGTSVGAATVTTTAAETPPAVTGGSTTTTPSAAAPSPAAPVTKKPATPHAPVTARSSSVLYKGPVYERTATGRVVPYVIPPPMGQTNGDTGGSIADLAAATKPELLVPGSTARYVERPRRGADLRAAGGAGDHLGRQPADRLPYIYGGGHAIFVSARL